MLVLCGCPDPGSKSTEDNKVNVMKADVKASTTFINHYFRFFMQRKFDVMSSFYSKTLESKLKNETKVIEPHPEGYHIGEGETENNDVKFAVEIYNGYSDKPYYSEDEFVYIVGLENGKTYIKDIQKKKSTEIFEKDGELYRRNGEEVEGEKLTSLKELPEYVIPTDALSGHKKLPLPNKKYGVAALSPDKKTLVFTTADKNSFLGIIKEESEAETFKQDGSGQSGGQQGGGQSGGGSQSAGGASQQSTQKPKLKIKTIDLLYNAVIHNVCFSPDGKKIVIQYSVGQKPSKLMMYDAESGSMVPFKTNKQFMEETCYFNNPYFETADALIFTVAPVAGSSAQVSKSAGTWLLDIAKGKLNKIG